MTKQEILVSARKYTENKIKVEDNVIYMYKGSKVSPVRVDNSLTEEDLQMIIKDMETAFNKQYD